MSKVKKQVEVKSSPKTMRIELEEKLVIALADWKEKLGDKKFSQRIKKAAKAFIKDFKIPTVKATSVKKKTAAKKKANSAKNPEKTAKKSA